MNRTRIVALLTVTVIILSCFISCGFFGNNDADNDNNDACQHTTTQVVGVKAATCAEKGYTGDRVCTACTKVLIKGSETPILDHSFDDGQVTKKPTCITTGIKTFTCFGCGTTKSEALATVSHDDIYHDAQDGTHFHTCATCTLNEHGQHNPTDSGTAVPANCTEPSHTVFTCADCLGVYKVYSDTDTALDHDLGEWTENKAASCVANGRKTQECEREGCDYSHSVTISATGIHNTAFYEYVTAPLCNADGVATYKCKDCTYTEEISVPMTGVHSYVQLENTGDGWVRKQCPACEYITSSYDASTLKEASISSSNINKSEALEVNVESAALQFPENVVSQITSGTDVSISAGIIDEDTKNDALSNVADEEQKAILEEANIYDFTVKVDGEAFSQNFNEKVAITISYYSSTGDAEGIVIYYLAENGTIETITDVIYNPTMQELTFFVSHFSYYAVAYKETQDMRCKRGLHDYVATSETREATCYSFGYTVYKCTNCSRKTIDDMVERKPHRYGDEIAAHPGCDRADYITRACQNEGCRDVLKVKLVGATGHKIKAPASCETHAICEKCNSVVALATGHDWSGWETVVAPSEDKTGLRRRYCANCGNKEESILAATGSIDTIQFNTAEELFEVILDEVLELSSGKIKFNILYNDQNVSVNADVMETENGHRAFITVDISDSELQENVEFYYDNGVIVAVSYEHGDAISNINSIITLDVVAEFKTALEQIHSQLDNLMHSYIYSARDFLESYTAIYGDEINKILAKADVEYDVHELLDTLDSIETVYAYLSLRLGYTTAQQMVEGVVLPNGDDVRRFLEAFMTVSEKDGVTTYTLDSAPIFEDTNEVVDALEELVDRSVAEVFYEGIKEDILALDPTLTDFNAVMEYIAKEFPGSFTLADAINKYIDFSEEKDFVSIKTIYSMIDTIALEIYQKEFNSENLVKQNKHLTLNDLAKSMTGDETTTIQDVYDLIAEEMYSTKYGDVDYAGQTIREWCEDLRNAEDVEAFDAYLTISFDSNGRLVGIALDSDFEENVSPYSNFDFEIVYDESVSVEIPKAIKDKMATPSVSYDKNGNLLISGLPSADEYDFSLQGHADISIKDVITKDDAVSAEMGFDVYVLNREYWNETTYIGHLYIYNGEYCSYNSSLANIYEREDSISGDELLDFIFEEYDAYKYDTRNLLAGTDINVYRCEYYSIDVSDIVLDFFKDLISYERDGVTYYSNSYYSTSKGYCVSKEYTEEELKSTFSISAPYTNSEADHYLNVGDTYSPLSKFDVSLGSKKVSLFGYMQNGAPRLFTNSPYYKTLISAFTPAAQPEHDFSSSYDTTALVPTADGGMEEISITSKTFYKYKPAYFCKISDEQYIKFNSRYVLSSIDTSGYEQLALPDGNTLYVEIIDKNNSYSATTGYELAVGYASTDSGIYVPAIAAINNGDIVNYYYREATSTFRFDLGNMNVMEHVSKSANGDYVISAELINNINKLCKTSGCYNLMANGEINTADWTTNIMFSVSEYYKVQNAETEPISYSLWEQLFDSLGGGPGIYEDLSYQIVFNKNGTVSLVFAGGVTIADLSYSNIEVNVEGELEYDADMSNNTGFDIYSYTTNYETPNYSGSYVYKNGKYYNYSISDVFDFVLSASPAPTKWSIYNMAYRFDTVGAEGMPNNVPVFETRISFPGYYWEYITIYTIVIDGRIYALTEASETGESLLTFEGWMPLEDYMNSLEFVYTGEDDYSYETVNYNGQQTEIYSTRVAVYETDENGNRLSDSAKYTIDKYYILVDGAIQYIVSDSYTSVFTVGDEVSISHVPADAEREVYTATYNGKTYEMVDFSWMVTETFKAYYIKLAGSYYAYDDYYYNGWGAFTQERLSEYSFNNSAFSKVWYYKVIDSETGSAHYYTEFIPSDYGFTPSGTVIDISAISGSLNEETFLGYTSDGDKLYEVVYYLDETSDDFEYTMETQSDGTVFYHGNGAGYLKVTSDQVYVYYVKARKVESEDGSSRILCMLHGASLGENDTRNYADALVRKDYIKVNGNTVTFSKKLITAMLSDYAEIKIKVKGQSGNSTYHYIDAHSIRSWLNSAN